MGKRFNEVELEDDEDTDDTTTTTTHGDGHYCSQAGKK